MSVFQVSLLTIDYNIVLYRYNIVFCTRSRKCTVVENVHGFFPQNSILILRLLNFSHRLSQW